jgi:hypothetical protein
LITGAQLNRANAYSRAVHTATLQSGIGNAARRAEHTYLAVYTPRWSTCGAAVALRACLGSHRSQNVMGSMSAHGHQCAGTNHIFIIGGLSMPYCEAGCKHRVEIAETRRGTAAVPQAS